jgi:hypothetical protein
VLAHTEAGDVAVQAVLAVKDLHSALFPALSDALPQFFPSETYSLEALSWAAGVLATYSVQLQTPGARLGKALDEASDDAAFCVTTAIVPLVEAAPRHKTEATCFHEYDAEADRYVLKTLRALRCGDEVSVCRGRGGDAAALLGDSGAAYADRKLSGLGSWMREGQGVLLQVAGTQTKGRVPVSSTTAIKAYVTEPNGKLLLWPPGAKPALSELRKAVTAYIDCLQPARGVAVNEAAIVEAGRTGCGEAMLRCREYVLSQLAVASAVCDAIDRGTST